ncbi:MAG: hypothetical protein ACKPKO_44555, partial [Candidatus Fonsibacter sp.]
TLCTKQKFNPWVGALPLEVFSEVFSKLQNGMSARTIHLGGTGGRLKTIRFCWMEEKSERDRDFMKSVATMVLLRYEIMAYCCLHSELGGLTGYLGSPTGLWLSSRR